MTSEADSSPEHGRSLGKQVAALVWRLLHAAFVWLYAIYAVGLVELRGNGGIREVYTHVRANPDVIQAVTIAFLAGWLLTARHVDESSKERSAWMNKHPLATQALVGTVILVGIVVPFFLWRR
jgi:hypothetical protein